MTVLALDFDGVICDGIHEVLRLSYACVQAMHDGTAPSASALDDEISEEKQQLFLNRRSCVRPARNFYLLWRWIEDFPERSFSLEAFEELAAEYAGELEEFEKLFFALREEIMENDVASWLRLNPLFPGVVETWPSLMRSPLYIVTTKNESATRRILGEYALSTTGLYCHGSFRDKGEAISLIASRERVRPSEVLFIDDHPLHLADAARAGADARLAQWGYGPRDWPRRVASFDQLPLVLGSEERTLEHGCQS